MEKKWTLQERADIKEKSHFWRWLPLKTHTHTQETGATQRQVRKSVFWRWYSCVSNTSRVILRKTQTKITNPQLRQHANIALSAQKHDRKARRLLSTCQSWLFSYNTTEVLYSFISYPVIGKCNVVEVLRVSFCFALLSPEEAIFSDSISGSLHTNSVWMCHWLWQERGNEKKSQAGCGFRSLRTHSSVSLPSGRWSMSSNKRNKL